MWLQNIIASSVLVSLNYGIYKKFRPSLYVLMETWRNGQTAAKGIDHRQIYIRIFENKFLKLFTFPELQY